MSVRLPSTLCVTAQLDLLLSVKRCFSLVMYALSYLPAGGSNSYSKLLVIWYSISRTHAPQPYTIVYSLPSGRSADTSAPRKELPKDFAMDYVNKHCKSSPTCLYSTHSIFFFFISGLSVYLTFLLICCWGGDIIPLYIFLQRKIGSHLYFTIIGLHIYIPVFQVLILSNRIVVIYDAPITPWLASLFIIY